MLRCYDHHNTGENDTLAPIPLSQMEERWSNPQFHLVTRLVVDCCCRDNNSEGLEVIWQSALWKRLCQLIQARLPNIETLRIEGLTDDAKFATLLQHLSSQKKGLKQLHLERIQCDLPRTFAQIGDFQNLQSFKVSETFGSFGEVQFLQSDQSLQMLANSLKKLHPKQQLREIYIHDWNCSRQAWKPVIQATRSNFHLTRVEIDEFGCGCCDDTDDSSDDTSCSSCEDTAGVKEQSVCGYQLGKEDFASLQNGPRMNQIREKLQLSSNNQYNGKLEPWVEAMISCHELPLDCFHFFLSQLPPETYLHSGHWDTTTTSAKQQKHDQETNKKKRKQPPAVQDLHNNGWSKKAKCSKHSTKNSKTDAACGSSHPSWMSHLLLLSSGGCSLERPMRLSSLFSNTWRSSR